MTKEELDTLLLRYEHLASEAARAKRMDDALRMKTERITMLERDITSLRRHADLHRIDMDNARKHIDELTAYGKELREIIGPRKKSLPKIPTYDDDIPF